MVELCCKPCTPSCHVLAADSCSSELSTKISELPRLDFISSGSEPPKLDPYGYRVQDGVADRAKAFELLVCIIRKRNSFDWAWGGKNFPGHFERLTASLRNFF